MDLRRLIRPLAVAGPLLALAVLLGTLVLLAGDLESDISQLGRWAPWLAFVALITVLVLVAVIGWQALDLWRQRRRAAPGSRLATRWALALVLVAVPPIVLVYGFALRFLNDTVDSWFNVQIEQSLDDALALGRDYLGAEQARAERASASLAATLELLPRGDWQATLEDAIDRGEARQLVVFAGNGQVLALAADDARLLRPTPPDPAVALSVRDGLVQSSAETLGDDLVVRVRRLLDDALFEAVYELPSKVQPLIRNIERSWFDYQQLAVLRSSLKLSFSLILSAVLLLAALMAILAALAVARRQVEPIKRLAEATGAVARGEFRGDLPSGGEDELGFLTQAFNRMAADLRLSSDQARSSQAETERQRAYLGTVLERLSSGVLGFDPNGQLRTANPAAIEILGAELREVVGQPLARMAEGVPRLAALARTIALRIASGAREWREELALPQADGGNSGQVLLLRGAALPVVGDGETGHVVVIDDQTRLNRAQREAAWFEVAQRLAHEVKNPLTPIQLAAERLNHRLRGKLAEADAEVLAKSTRTIVAQVDALKSMVDAFADYARAPQISLRPLAFDALLGEVLDLYDDPERCRIVRQIEPGLPRLRGDSGRLRQLLHNLIKNAIEASGELPELDASLCREGEGVLFSLADRGVGLPAGFDQRWFEPYRSDKPKGTGLGLAVVAKVTDEHGGRVTAVQREGGGAVVRVWLPSA